MASPVATDETQLKYDVFISFSGSDTRNNFTSHLHAALKREKIHAFIDTIFPRGQGIGPSLFKAIEESEVAVIIFSESYGGSGWCLNELVKIMKYMDERGMVVLPVFYCVEPTDVKKQTGQFGDEFKKLKAEYMDEGDKWSDALEKAANISGLVWKDFRPDSKLVDEVVKSVLKSVFEKLKKPVSSVSADLVGMEFHITNMLQLLQTGRTNVIFLGLWGMGGIGKTTCAKALMDRIAGAFESCYFQPDVREESRKHPTDFLQNKIIGEILDLEKTPNMLSDLDRKRLRQKKVLIILDNVSETKQVETIAGKHEWFAPGSRIIITSRDKQVLKCVVDELYEVGYLNNGDALRLFSLHAFKRNSPDESYMEMSKRAVSYARGVPLALKVLGSLLYTKLPNVWKSQLEKLRTKPERQILDVLKISYDELDDDEKNIFLDIACLFKEEGEDKDSVTDILDGCGFYAGVGISRLIDKCLISITKWREKTWMFQMHDLLKEMAFDIVRKESTNCEKRSRLWEDEEISHVLTKNMGSELTQCIKWSPMSVKRDVPLSLSRVPNLRLLRIDYSHMLDDTRQDCSPPYIPSSLSYLYWENYPWKLLHDDFSPEKLVYLSLQKSNIEQLWSEAKVSPQLKYIVLFATNLNSLPDLSSAINLKVINLISCNKIRSLPSFIHQNSLQTLNFSCCSSLEEFPSINCYTSLLTLDLSGTGIKELPVSLNNYSSLVKLRLDYCTRLCALPSSICELKSLQKLNLSHSGILELPDSIGSLSALQKLSLQGIDIQEIPSSICQLDRLEKLYISDCNELQYLPKLPCSVNFVDASDCSSMKNVATSAINVIGKASELTYTFNFTNCFKLYDSSRENIMSFLRADQNIETTLSGFSTRSKGPRDLKFNIIVPGTTIPKWFRYQNIGTGLDADFHNFHYKISSIGLAFSVVVEFVERVDVTCECTTRNGDVLHLKFRSPFTCANSSGNVIIWMVRDLCDNTEFEEADCLRKATFKFTKSSYLPFAKIKMCGVHVICFSDTLGECSSKETASPRQTPLKRKSDT